MSDDDDLDRRSRTFWTWLPIFALVAAFITATGAAFIGGLLAAGLGINRTYATVVIGMGIGATLAWYGETIITKIATWVRK